MKYLILGAGPSGLTFACRLLKNGCDDFLIIDKEDEAGGLCRSKDVDGSPLDIGGGHFLDVKRQDVLDFLFSYMNEDEWDIFDRDSRIEVNGNIINSPIEANIWQMKLKDQVEYLKAIAIAGCNLDTPMPERFVEWIYWKLGKKIAEDYMIPYNQKMFGKNLDELGTYWLNKLPNVSFEETLISCLERKAYGSQPAHARFYYPKKYGYGEIWKRMGESLKDRLILNTEIKELDLDKREVNGIYSADRIVTTIPWDSIGRISGLSEENLKAIGKLKHTSIVIEYINENMDTKAHWIYYPDPELTYHRKLIRHNFCRGSKGYWTETNRDRFDDKAEDERQYFINEYAYPLNTIGKEEIMEKILKEASSKEVYGLGRWGEWQHYNSDLVVKLSLDLADRLEG
ncbi:MAG: NAD(P)-binding protein [Lachnospiraceae bacterium]|nr:NAD(P)-binding protein [Lachnospiraceae bacterium]